MAKRGPKPMDREPALKHIFAEVAAGRSLDKVLNEDAEAAGLPSPSTFWRWHMEDEKIRDNLAIARTHGVERHMDEIIDIADKTDEEPASRKVRIYARVQRAQMIAPRKYGPKIDLTSDGKALGLKEALEAFRGKPDAE